MIDIEAWGTTPGCAIASIGAAFFDPFEDYSDDIPTIPMFYRNVSLDSCLHAGLTIDESTVFWWMKQGEEARQALSEPEPISLSRAMKDLKDFYWTQKGQIGKKAIYTWSHGLTYDLPFLSYAAKKVNVQEPWMYQNCRDTRTLFDLAFAGKKPKFQDNDVKHHALYDSMTQIVQVQEAYRALNLSKPKED